LTLINHTSHCADLVLSFGVKAVITATASSPLGNFLIRWVATTSPLMEIIGSTMTPDFVERLIPVFSSRSHDHFTLVNPSAVMVGGRRVVCPLGCNGLLDDKKRGNGHAFHISLKCLGCQYRATYVFPRDAAIMEGDSQTIIAVPNQAYLRTPFPVPLKPLEWTKMTPSPHATSRSNTPASLPIRKAPALTDKSPSPYLIKNPLAHSSKRLRVPSPSSSGSRSSSMMASPAPTPPPPPSPLVAQEDVRPDPLEEVVEMLAPVELGPMIPRNLPRQEQSVKRMRRDSGSQVIKKKKSRN
jgi:hypothetical protein